MEFMFFRRERELKPRFQERMESRRRGFTVSPRREVRAGEPGGYAVDLKEIRERCRWKLAQDSIGDEIGALVDGGYQKFFRTPGGKKKPALADELKALHDFEEDLKEAFGQKSLYNESLGTVSTLYQYDRVKDRDRGVPKRIWE